MTKRTLDGLTTKAHKYLKKVEHWSAKYNEVVFTLRLHGYHQVGELNTRPPYFMADTPEIVHYVFREHKGGGDGFMTASSFLEEVALGPMPRSSEFGEKERGDRNAS